MKDREYVARFIEVQMASAPGVCKREKGGKHHYGLQDLRDLLDFIYGGPPESDEEALRPSFWQARDESVMPADDSDDAAALRSLAKEIPS